MRRESVRRDLCRTLAARDGALRDHVRRLAARHARARGLRRERLHHPGACLPDGAASTAPARAHGLLPVGAVRVLRLPVPGARRLPAPGLLGAPSGASAAHSWAALPPRPAPEHRRAGSTATAGEASEARTRATLEDSHPAGASTRQSFEESESARATVSGFPG